MRVNIAIRALSLTSLVACATAPDTCDDFQAEIDAGEMQRAEFGVRIVAPPGFRAFRQAPTFPLSTGTLVMEPWVRDGELGAIGIDETGACYWYAARSK